MDITLSVIQPIVAVSVSSADDVNLQISASTASPITVTTAFLMGPPGPSAIDSGITPADIGLGNVDNTSDEDKPVSSAVALALGEKLDSSAVPAGTDRLLQFNRLGELSTDVALEFDYDLSALKIGQPTVLPDNPLAIKADVDGYAQVNLQNTNPGISSSADYVITADNGDDLHNYADFGLCNTTLTTGTCSNHDAATNQGRYFYINVNGTQRMMRFDMLHRTLTPWAYLRYAQGTALVGQKLAIGTFIDGATKVAMLYLLRNTGTELFNCLVQR